RINKSDEALYVFSQLRVVPRAHRAQFEGHRLRAGADSPAPRRRRAIQRRLPRAQPAGAGADAGRRRQNSHESLAIIEYLDEKQPEPPLLPKDPADKALVRSMAMIVACEVHPIQNLRVLSYVKKEYN